jgi:hypothetical protein
MTRTCIPIGGLVAAGFDSSAAYLLAITHSGRGVFSTTTWGRVARNTELAYPQNGRGVGIGPIEGEIIPVAEMNYDTGTMNITSVDGRLVLECESSHIVVRVSDWRSNRSSE